MLNIAVDRESYETIEQWQTAQRILNNAVNTALDKQLRVDENVMRQEQFDRLPEIIKLIQDEERRMRSLN